MKEEKMSYRTKEILSALCINSLITLILGYCFGQSLFRILFMELIMLFLNLIIYLACLPNRGNKLTGKEELCLFCRYMKQSKWAFLSLLLLIGIYALISPEWSFSIYFFGHYLLLFLNFGAIRSVMNIPITFDYEEDEVIGEG